MTVLFWIGQSPDTGITPDKFLKSLIVSTIYILHYCFPHLCLSSSLVGQFACLHVFTLEFQCHWYYNFMLLQNELGGNTSVKTCRSINKKTKKLAFI